MLLNKLTLKNTDGETIEVHRLDQGKLNSLLEGAVTLEENENQMIQKEVIRQHNERMANKTDRHSYTEEKTSDAEEEDENTAQASQTFGGEKTLTLGKTQTFGKDLTSASKIGKTPKKQEKGFAPISGAGKNSTMPSHYVEDWINETMSHAEHFHGLGVLKNPAHRSPLHRYEVDKQKLVSFGLPVEEIDRIYRSLFVHSFGVFQMIKEATKRVCIRPGLFHQESKKETILDVIDGEHETDDLNPTQNLKNLEKDGQTNSELRSAVQRNLWRVFQILIEYSCQSDYQMLTQSIEKQGQKQILEMQEFQLQLEQQFIKKDKEYQDKLKTLEREQFELEQMKVRYEQERFMAVEDLKKAEARLEEEVQLRLFFEQKLNSLHLVNMETEALQKRTTDNNMKLTAINHVMMKDQRELQAMNQKLKFQKVNNEKDLTVLKQTVQSHEAAIGSYKGDLERLDGETVEVIEIKNELHKKADELQREVTDAHLRIQELENRFDNEQLFSKQIEKFYNNSQARLKEYLTKSEDDTVELNRKEVKIQKLQVELINLQRLSDDALQEIEGLKEQVAKYLEDNDDFDQQNRSLGDMINEVEKLNVYQKAQVEEMTEEIVLLRVMKIDTEKKLQIQMTEADNLKKLNDDLEALFKKQTKQVLKHGRDINDLENEKIELTQQRAVIAGKFQQYKKQADQEDSNLRQQLNQEQSTNEVVTKRQEEVITELEELTQEHRDLETKYTGLEADYNGKLEHIGLLEKEIDILKDNNKMKLSGMFAKVLERDMYEAEVKKCKGEIQQKGDVMKKEIKICKDKYKQEFVKNDILEFRLEDERQQHLRFKKMYDDGLVEVVRARAEQKYLSKKYIAFLIYKGWTKIRRAAFETEINHNVKIIAKQEKTIEDNTKLLAQLEKQVDTLEKSLEYQREELNVTKRKLGQAEIRLLEANTVKMVLQEEIQELKDKYVNIKKAEQGEQVTQLMLDQAFPGIRTKELPAQTQKYWDKPHQVVEYLKNKHSQEEKERPHGEEVDLEQWDIIKKQTTWVDGKLVVEDYNDEFIRKRVKYLWGKMRNHFEAVGKKVINDRKEEIKRKARKEIEKLNQERELAERAAQKAEEEAKAVELPAEAVAGSGAGSNKGSKQQLKTEEMPKQTEELKSGSVSKTQLQHSESVSSHNIQTIQEKMEQAILDKVQKQKLKLQRTKKTKKRNEGATTKDGKLITDSFRTDDVSLDQEDAEKLKLERQQMSENSVMQILGDIDPHAVNDLSKVVTMNMLKSPTDQDIGEIDLIANFDKLKESMLSNLVIKFFRDYSAMSVDDLEKKAVLKNVINAIMQDFNFRLIARFEYEIDPNDITRGFKAYNLIHEQEIELQHKKSEYFMNSLSLIATNQKKRLKQQISTFFKRQLERVLKHKEKSTTFRDDEYLRYSSLHSTTGQSQMNKETFDHNRSLLSQGGTAGTQGTSYINPDTYRKFTDLDYQHNSHLSEFPSLNNSKIQPGSMDQTNMKEQSNETKIQKILQQSIIKNLINTSESPSPLVSAREGSSPSSIPNQKMFSKKAALTQNQFYVQSSQGKHRHSTSLVIKGKRSNDQCYFDHKQFMKLHDKVNSKMNQSTIGFRKKNSLSYANEHSLPSVRSLEKSGLFVNKLKPMDVYGNISENTQYVQKSNSLGMNKMTYAGDKISGWPINVSDNRHTQYLDIPSIYQNKSKAAKHNLLGKTGQQWARNTQVLDGNQKLPKTSNLATRKVYKNYMNSVIISSVNLDGNNGANAARQQNDQRGPPNSIIIKNTNNDLHGGLTTDPVMNNLLSENLAQSMTDTPISMDEMEMDMENYEQMVYTSLNEQNDIIEDQADSQLHSPTIFKQQKLPQKDNFNVDVIQEVSHQDSIISSGGNDKVHDRDGRYRHQNISSKQRIMIDIQQKMDQQMQNTKQIFRTVEGANRIPVYTSSIGVGHNSTLSSIESLEGRKGNIETQPDYHSTKSMHESQDLQVVIDQDGEMTQELSQRNLVNNIYQLGNSNSNTVRPQAPVQMKVHRHKTQVDTEDILDEAAKIDGNSKQQKNIRRMLKNAYQK